MTVIRGRLLLVLSGSERTLRAGETAAFAPDLPHACQGAGRGPCDALMTVHLPVKHRRA